MMAIDWAGLAGNSISAALGGGLALLGGYFANRASEKARHTEVLRARGEELYSLNAQFLMGLGSYFLRRMSVVYGTLDYNQMLDQEIENLKGKSFDLSRMEMLVNVYFPEARSAYDSLIEARNVLNEVASKHKRAYSSGDENGKKFELPFTEAMDSIDAAGKLLGETILRSLRSL